MIDETDSQKLYIDLLTPDKMKSARAKLIEKNDWFTHQTTLAALHSIRNIGLMPKNPGGMTADIHRILSTAIIHDPDHILCFRPIMSCPVNVQRFEPICTLAISKADLPHRVSLDWSYPYSWKLAAVVLADQPELSLEQIFCHVVIRSGSVACYDGVPASALRVRTDAAHGSNPVDWPMLVRTPDEAILRH